MSKTYKVQLQRGKRKVNLLRERDKDRRNKRIRVRFDIAQRENEK